MSKIPTSQGTSRFQSGQRSIRAASSMRAVRSGNRPVHAVSWSGGKDSTLALDRAVRAGLDVRYLFNIYAGNTGRVRFHGTRAELIKAQADALGLELVQAHTHPDDFEPVFLRTLRELEERGVHGVVFGNIHLGDVRAWYEERTTAAGFEHLEPLWNETPEALVDEFIERGYRTRVISINLEMSPPEWLGRELDRTLAEELARHGDIDPAGEHGEYHSFAFDGPLFRHPIDVEAGPIHEREGHRFLDLTPAGRSDKMAEDPDKKSD